MNKVRTLVALTVVAGGIAGRTGTAHAASEGCTAAAGLSCSYVARQAGGITAIGNGWRVTVIRKGKNRAITFGPAGMTDVGHSTLKRTNAIRPGDEVFVRTELPAAPCLCLCLTGQFGAVAVGTDSNR